MKAPREICMHKIQSFESLFETLYFKVYIKPFQTYFSNHLSKVYLVNRNKEMYFSGTYTVQDFFDVSSDRTSSI